MSEEKGLKIIRLEAENVKKIKAIEIVPKGSTIVISGKNENGKTSVLDCIFLAVGGKEASKGLKKPIRAGEDSAYSKVDLGDIIVTRKWTSNDKSYLTVENKDGAKFSSPQAILDNLIGDLSFDPLAFSNMSDKEQKEVVLGLVDIGIDLEEWEKDKKEAYDERTVTNRTVKDLEGQLSGMPEPAKDAPIKEVNASEIMTKIQRAQKVKDDNDSVRRFLDDLKGQETALSKEKDELLTQLKAKNQAIQELAGRIVTGNERVDALEDPDMELFQKNLEKIDETNKTVRDNQSRTELVTKLETAQKESQALTDELTTMDKDKTEAIEKAEFPIEHLGFDEMGVTYKKIPFSQCSAAERLRVSLSMAIALNPKLKVLRITDGSLLDSTNMKIIEEMVEKNDYQLWIECVMDNPDGASVYIEDGEIKEGK